MRTVVAALIALLTLAAPAFGEVRTLAEVHTPDRGGRTAFPVIDAHGGAVAWSDYDASVDAWRLMANVGGATQALPVPPRVTPFDVDLGPDRQGGLLAVYSRCTRGLRLDLPTPQVARAGRHGCDIYSYSFTTGREEPVARANSRADKYWPTVWRGRIAFVRGYARRRDPDRTSTPYLYLGSRRLRLPSPVITIRESGPFGRRTVDRRLSAMVEGLDLRGRTVAYAWTRIADFGSDSFIYLSRRGREPFPASKRGATTGGGAAEHVRSIGAPALVDGIVVQWLFRNTGEPEYFAAFARGITGEPLLPRGDEPLASPPTKAVAFAASEADVFYIDGGPGAQFDATSQPGGSFLLKVDNNPGYSRMRRSWQPMRPPR
jgi:hypothetical protein